VNVKWLFQEDILTPNDFTTFLDQAALNRMLSSNNYGLNKLSVLKQQKFRAFHKWLWQQKAQDFDLSDTNILDSFDAKALATILAEEGSNGMMRECDGYNKGTKKIGVMLPTFKGDQSGWELWNNKIKTFLSQQRRSNGKPYIYVIVDLEGEPEHPREV